MVWWWGWEWCGGGGGGDGVVVVVVVVSKIRRQQQQFVSFFAVSIFTQGRFRTFLGPSINKLSGPTQNTCELTMQVKGI